MDFFVPKKKPNPNFDEKNGASVEQKDCWTMLMNGKRRRLTAQCASKGRGRQCRQCQLALNDSLALNA